MYLILGSKVILGLDGFIRDQVLGTQFRLWFFGINIWYATGDKDVMGNGFALSFGLPNINQVL